MCLQNLTALLAPLFLEGGGDPKAMSMTRNTEARKAAGPRGLG